MVSFLSRDYWSIRRKHEMNSWIWHQVGLEFCNIHVKGSIESERSCKRRDNLGNKSVQVSVGWSLDIEVSSANIINSFVINHDSDVGVLKEGVSGKYGVVWFNNSG
jgi:hypothetical protein